MSSNSSSMDTGSYKGGSTTSADPSENIIVRSFLSILEEARSRSNSLKPTSEATSAANQVSRSLSPNRLTVDSAHNRSLSSDRISPVVSPSNVRRCSAVVERSNNSSRESISSNPQRSGSVEIVLCSRCRAQMMKVNGQWVDKEGGSRKPSSAGGSILDFEGATLDLSSSTKTRAALNSSHSASLLSSAIANILSISSVRF